MKSVLVLCLLCFIFSFAFCQQPSRPLNPKDLNIVALVQPIPMKNKFMDEKYNIYCGSVTKGDNGKYYMFYSRWPFSDYHNAWPFNSEIALAKADKPEGPFTHVKVVLPARGAAFWDGSATHNPNIMRYKGKYYLFYMGTSATSVLQRPIMMSDKNWWDYRNSQRIGVAVAKDPEGEWERFDKPVLDVSSDPLAPDALMVSNPAATFNDKGEIILVYKQVSKGETYKGGKVTYGVAFAKSPVGPFKKEIKRIFELKEGNDTWMVAEDPYIWFQDKTYFVIVRDVVGKFTGQSGAWALLVSENGKEWSPAKYPKVIKALPEWEDGSLCTGILGRPCLLIENGSPRFLYAAYTIEEQGRRSCNIAIPLKAAK